MQYTINCQKCVDYLGFGTINPSHEIPPLCLSELEQWCMFTRSTKCAECMELNLQDFVPDPCFNGLRKLFREECETTTTVATNALPHTQPLTQEGSSNGSPIGTVPIILFIGLLVVVMVMICRKLFELQETESGIDGDGLISDIHLDHPAASNYDRVDVDCYPSASSGYETSGRDVGHDYHAHRYPEGHNAMSDCPPAPIEDVYRYHSQTHQHSHPHERHYSDLSDSQSYSFAKHSSYNSQQANRQIPTGHQHQPYASPNISSAESLLEAQDSLRAGGKEGIRSRGRNNSGLAPLPPVHEHRHEEPGSPAHRTRPDSVTYARQLRVNTLINQNTSTSSIYSGELLIPSNPVPRKESNETRTSAISESGTSHELPLKERIRRYSMDKSRSSSRMTPERHHDFSNHQEEIDENLPLKERIRKYSFNRSGSRDKGVGGDEMMEETYKPGRERDRSRQREEYY